MAKVAVLMGGSSFEREFSLISGKNICEALEEAGAARPAVDAGRAADGIQAILEDMAEAAFEAQAAAATEEREDTGLTVAFFYITSSGTFNVRNSDDYVAQMIEPIVMCDGAVLKTGSVMLAPKL